MCGCFFLWLENSEILMLSGEASVFCVQRTALLSLIVFFHTTETWWCLSFSRLLCAQNTNKARWAREGNGIWNQNEVHACFKCYNRGNVETSWKLKRRLYKTTSSMATWVKRSTDFVFTFDNSERSFDSLCAKDRRLSRSKRQHDTAIIRCSWRRQKKQKKRVFEISRARSRTAAHF